VVLPIDICVLSFILCFDTCLGDRKGIQLQKTMLPSPKVLIQSKWKKNTEGKHLIQVHAENAFAVDKKI